jgi:hypothetical protein
MSLFRVVKKGDVKLHVPIRLRDVDKEIDTILASIVHKDGRFYVTFEMAHAL